MEILVTFVGICHDPGSKQRVLQKFIREETGRSLGPCKNVPFNGGQAPACRIFILIHIYILLYRWISSIYVIQASAYTVCHEIIGYSSIHVFVASASGIHMSSQVGSFIGSSAITAPWQGIELDRGNHEHSMLRDFFKQVSFPTALASPSTVQNQKSPWAPSV